MTRMWQRWPMRRSRLAGEEGLLTAELALAIAFVLLPLIVFLAAAAQWPARQGAAALAASEGARAAALADDAVEARALMERQVDATMQASGFADALVGSSLDGDFARGEHLAVTVSVELPTIAVPGGATLIARRYDVTVVERVDVHRRDR